MDIAPGHVHSAGTGPTPEIGKGFAVVGAADVGVLGFPVAVSHGEPVIEVT